MLPVITPAIKQAAEEPAVRNNMVFASVDCRQPVLGEVICQPENIQLYPTMKTDNFSKPLPENAPVPKPRKDGGDPPEPEDAKDSEVAKQWFIFYGKVLNGETPEWTHQGRSMSDDSPPERGGPEPGQKAGGEGAGTGVGFMVWAPGSFAKGGYRNFLCETPMGGYHQSQELRKGLSPVPGIEERGPSRPQELSKDYCVIRPDFREREPFLRLSFPRETGPLRAVPEVSPRPLRTVPEVSTIISKANRGANFPSSATRGT